MHQATCVEDVMRCEIQLVLLTAALNSATYRDKAGVLQAVQRGIPVSAILRTAVKLCYCMIG